jgi:hypothetical protein
VTVSFHIPAERFKIKVAAQVVWYTIQKPCLVFKILCASRVCGSDEIIEERFKYIFENIKPTDSVVVGMFQRDRDQIAMNADLVKKYGQVK